jgi:hypothetical protein
LRARAIVLEPKFIDLDEPAPVLVMPAQAHPLRKPVGVYATAKRWHHAHTIHGNHQVFRRATKARSNQN